MQAFWISPDGNYIAFLSADEPTAEEECKKAEKDDAIVWGERKGEFLRSAHANARSKLTWTGHARLRLYTISTGQVRTLVEDIKHVDTCTWKPDSKVRAFGPILVR